MQRPQRFAGVVKRLAFPPATPPDDSLRQRRLREAMGRGGGRTWQPDGRTADLRARAVSSLCLLALGCLSGGGCARVAPSPFSQPANLPRNWALPIEIKTVL